MNFRAILLDPTGLPAELRDKNNTPYGVQTFGNDLGRVEQWAKSVLGAHPGCSVAIEERKWERVRTVIGEAAVKSVGIPAVPGGSAPKQAEPQTHSPHEEDRR